MKCQTLWWTHERQASFSDFLFQYNHKERYIFGGESGKSGEMGGGEVLTSDLETSCTGYGGLTLAVEGPSNVEIQTEELEDGTCGVSFCPSEPGAYIVSVKFSEEHVPGRVCSDYVQLYG